MSAIRLSVAIHSLCLRSVEVKSQSALILAFAARPRPQLHGDETKLARNAATGIVSVATHAMIAFLAKTCTRVQCNVHELGSADCD